MSPCIQIVYTLCQDPRLDPNIPVTGVSNNLVQNRQFIIPLICSIYNGYDLMTRYLLQLENIDLNFQLGDRKSTALLIACA